ncbi:MAG: hypothetical protein K9J25_07905 [Bacteroidales bacterium]|nr:hypothetical protein [Bacteroidales bacterium]
MDKKKPTNLLYVLNAIMPLIELGGTGIFASNSFWSIVLGVMPPEEGEPKKQIMEIIRKDETKHKIEGIMRLTQVADSITKRNDFNDENMYDFTYAIRQLIRYVFDDQKALNALNGLKDMYIDFITEYYYHSLEFGKKEEARKKLEMFGEILKEDDDLCKELAKIISYKPLN